MFAFMIPFLKRNLKKKLYLCERLIMKMHQSKRWNLNATLIVSYKYFKSDIIPNAHKLQHRFKVTLDRKSVV